MEIDDYVRTECGIAKCIRVIPIRENSFMYEFDSITYEDTEEKANFLTASELEEYKHSPNIIDLIEAGDYVNGCLVSEIKDKWLILNYADIETYEQLERKNENIKSIVTKEQFKCIEYKVGEDNE